MLEGISSALASIAASNVALDPCAAPGVMKISVLPHQIITNRSRWCASLKVRISARTCSASSRLLAPVLTLVPIKRLTYRWSNTAGHGRIASSSGRICSSVDASMTPAVVAASYPFSSKMSQAPNTRSSSDASGTKSLMSGERPSSRFPSRTVPISASEPIGGASPFRISSVPAMKVVLTAPMPTSRTPSLPCAGAISTGCFTAGHYIMATGGPPWSAS